MGAFCAVSTVVAGCLTGCSGALLDATGPEARELDESKLSPARNGLAAPAEARVSAQAPASVGPAVVGSAAVGSAAVGPAVVGPAAAGPAVVGSAAPTPGDPFFACRLPTPVRSEDACASDAECAPATPCHARACVGRTHGHPPNATTVCTRMMACDSVDANRCGCLDGRCALIPPS